MDIKRNLEAIGEYDANDDVDVMIGYFLSIMATPAVATLLVTAFSS